MLTNPEQGCGLEEIPESPPADNTPLLVRTLGTIGILYISSAIGYAIGHKEGRSVNTETAEARLRQAQTRIDDVKATKDLTAAKLALKTTWSPGILEKLQQTAVRLTWQNGNKTSQASGFLLAPNIIVTAKHAALNENLTLVETPSISGSPLPIWHSSPDSSRVEVVLDPDPDHDLALLIFPANISGRGQTLEAVSHSPESGITIAACTSSLGHFAVTKGGFVQRENEDGTLNVAMEIEQGNSGAAVIDINGRVIGVIAAQVLETENDEAPPRGVICPVTEKILEKLIKKARKQYPYLFNRTDDIAAEIRRERRSLEQVFSHRGKHRQKRGFAPMPVRQKSMRN